MTRSYFPSVDTATDESSPRSGAADSVRRRLERWFPRALVYREWRLNRRRYMFASVLLIVITLGPVFTGMFPSLILRQVVGELQGLALSTVGFGQVVLVPLVAVALGVLVMRTDTGSDRSHYLLSGPVRRRDVVRVKAGLGVAAIVAAYTVIGAALTAIAYQFPSASTTPVLAVMFGVAFGHALLCMALFFTGLAAGCTSSNSALTAVGALLAAAVPQFMGSLINFFDSSRFTGVPPWVPHPHGVLLFTTLVDEFSPLARLHVVTMRYNAFTTPMGLVYTFWFLAWVIAFWKFGAYLFEKAPIERMSDTFFYPILWYVVLGGTCFVVATVLGLVLTGLQNGYIFMVWFVLFYGLSWFVIRLLVRTAGSRMEGRS